MKKRRRKKKIGPIGIIILLLIVYISVIMLNQRKLMNDLESKKIELEHGISSLEKDIRNLEDEIDSSDSLQFIEKIARDELGMVKPREIIYIDKEKKKSSFFDVFKRDKH